MVLRDEELLRRFVACRDRGDVAGARVWWERLVEGNFDRLRGMVEFRARSYRLSPEEREDALSLALVKLWRNMVRTFEGGSMGEWVNATRRLVDFACLDVQRSAARRSEHETSWEAGTAGEDDGTATSWKEAERAAERHRRDAEKGAAAEFVAWAVPQIADERRRDVLERTLDGVPAEEIAAGLGVSMPNLYKIRERAMKDMRELRRRWDEA